MADEDEYGPVQDEKRRPLRKWIPQGGLQGRPMLSQPVASYKLLNRSTEQVSPQRATGDRNRSTTARPDPGPTRQRIAPPAVDELLREIDEEQANRLQVFDGYNPTPPRPRDGLGLQLRPQHDDINEYLTGPKWVDPRGIERGPPYVEVAETRPVPLPPPAVIKRPKGRTLYQEVGEQVVRPKPPPEVRKPPPKVFKSRRIRFKPYTFFEWQSGDPAKFLDSDWLIDILHVVAILRGNPEVSVRIRASVGITIQLPGTAEIRKKWIEAAMDKRGEAVSRQIKARGIDPRRVSTERGDIGATDDDRNVEFIFVVPPP